MTRDLKVTLSYIPESDLVTIVWWTAQLSDNFSSWSLWAPWTPPSTLPPPPDSRCHCAAGRAWPRCRRSGPWCRGIAAEPDSSDGTGRACRVCPPARQCYQCWWPSRAPRSSQAERASPADRGGHLHCQGHHDEPGVNTDTTHQISSKQLTFYLIVVNQNTPEMFFDKRMQLEQIHDALEPDFLQVSENNDPGCPNLLGLDKGDRTRVSGRVKRIPERIPACEAPSSLSLLIRIFSPPWMFLNSSKKENISVNFNDFTLFTLKYCLIM